MYRGCGVSEFQLHIWLQNEEKTEWINVSVSTREHVINIFNRRMRDYPMENKRISSVLQVLKKKNRTMRIID